MRTLANWTKGPTAGRIRERGPRETKPTYTHETPKGVYYIMPSRDAAGLWIAWEVKVNTYQPDAKGRHWTRVSMALTLSEGVSDAARHAEEEAC